MQRILRLNDRSSRKHASLKWAGYKADDEERHPMDEDYLQAMSYGMPPQVVWHGYDRLTMLLTNTAPFAK
jgi:lysyl-tRNA synthetase class 2